MKLLAGLDLGSVQAKLIVAEPGRLNQPLMTLVRPNQGRSCHVAVELLVEAAKILPTEAAIHLGVTGTSAASFCKGEIGSLVYSANQLTAAAVTVSTLHKKAGTIIDLGGRFSKWILLKKASGKATAAIEDFALNGLCAAGSGVFLEQQAARLMLSIDELGRLAQKAKRGATIAGRCSVFAKSDMIHLQQKGTPVDEIAYGLCLALARTFVSTVLEGRQVQSPVAFIGGGASNLGLIRAFCDVLGLTNAEVIISTDHLFSCACGAAKMAGDFSPVALSALLNRLQKLYATSIAPTARHGSGIRLIPQDGGKQNRLPENPSETPMETKERILVHLGIDVGSVSTNLVLLSADLSYRDGIYVATGGRPVAAIAFALQELKKRHGHRLEVLSVGATGSGRYLAQRLVGADLVKNEITAQLVSAASFFPDVETIFEIGGQDAKFISARNGLLQDFEMNKICSAGTGSFLEEQAERLGVAIVDEFSRLAFASSSPVNLGSRCTVFMDGELCQAMAASNPVEDLCAGLAYAVARNYLEKVVAGKNIGKTIVFQGGTSANGAVVSALAGLLQRKIRVHPYGRVSGAIGAALLAAADRVERDYKKSLFRGFDSCNEHSISSFECMECINRCQVNQIEVGGQKAHFGDICERYTSQDNGKTSQETNRKNRPFQELFAARDALLTHALPQKQPSDRPRIGLIRTSLMLEYLPFWTHLLNGLNFDPVVAEGMTGDWEIHSTNPGLCLPQKLAAAEIRHLFQEQHLDRVLLPSVLELEPYQKGDRPNTCLYSQQLPDMLRPHYGNRLLTPQLGIANSNNIRREGSLVLAEALGASTEEVNRSWQIAIQHQEAFNQARWELGRKTLNELVGYGVVVIGKPYNLHDPRANLGLARQLERLDLPAIPMDLLPLNLEHLDERWYMLPWLLNRHQLRALQILASYPHLYPICISNYGCGPDAFATKHLRKFWRKRPRLFLEFDGHRGEAGLVTRLEAFADEIVNYELKEKRSYSFHIPKMRKNNIPTPGSRCFLPYTSEHVHVYAGMLRRVGFATQTLPPPDEESALLGEKVSSGRECHPFTLIAGDLVKCTQTMPIEPGDRFFIPGTRLPCLLSQYGDGFRHILDDLAEKRLQIFDQHPGEATAMFGSLGMIEIYEGLTIIDYLIVAACSTRPYEKDEGTVDLWLADSCRRIEDCLAGDEDKRDCLTRCLDDLSRIKVKKKEKRPVVGITGDLYTRINISGNKGLFRRVEEMGCEVWPSPFFAASTDFELPQNAKRWKRRGKHLKALSSKATAGLLSLRAARLAAALDPGLKVRCVEPSQPTLQSYALPYVSENSNHLIRAMVAKMVDFSKRGADGVISAIGLNCMAGTAAASAIGKIREDHNGIPIISLTYGSAEDLSQKIQLDTFLNQVYERYEKEVA